MARKIKIVTEATGEVSAELIEDRNPKTAQTIWNSLPIEARANTWGDEIYFSTSVKVKEENSQATVGLGDLGYWPPGKAFCIFFGPTPLSRGGEIRPASPINVFGRVLGNPEVFKKVQDGDKIRVERA
jgi:hypothetical protein